MADDTENKDDDGILNLSKKGLLTFPDLFKEKCRNLRFCYLEDNQLTSLPVNIFKDLLDLQWLDVRRNNIEQLPTSGLAGHCALEVLLLQSNRIKTLPIELAFVPKIRGLQVTGNPIENVPFEILASGLPSLLQYLQDLSKEETELLPVSETIIITDSAIKDGTIRGCKSKRERPIEELSKHKVRRRRPQQEALEATLNVRSYNNQRRESEKSLNRLCTVSRICNSLQRKSNCKAKIVTIEDIEKCHKETSEKSKLRETLSRQSQMLQRIKDREAIKYWRESGQKQKKKLLDNFQAYPSKSFLDKFPFGVTPEWARMPSRNDLFKTITEWEQREKRKTLEGNSPPTVNTIDLQREIDEITRSLQEIDCDFKQNENAKNSNYIAERMTEINKLRKTLKGLHDKLLLGC